MDQKELGETEDPKELIPGNPEAIFENARAIRDRATDIIADGQALKRLDASGWTGKAYDEWHNEHESHATDYIKTGDGMAAGAQPIELFAACLAWAQQQANHAIALYKQAKQTSKNGQLSTGETWTKIDPPPDADDPSYQAAQAILARARQQVQQVGSESAQALNDLADGAPQPGESTLGQVGHGVLDVAGLVPVVGDGLDLANAGWYAAEGKAGDAGLSAAAAVPFVGWGAAASKAAKWGAKGVKAGTEGAEAASKAARFGKAVRKDYRKTFIEAHPELDGRVVVHHAVEQNARKLYPSAGITEAEMHSLENLRGIPKEANSSLHLSDLRKDWDEFYETHPNPTKQDLLDHATKLDDKYGHRFNPPTR